MRIRYRCLTWTANAAGESLLGATRNSTAGLPLASCSLPSTESTQHRWVAVGSTPWFVDLVRAATIACFRIAPKSSRRSALSFWHQANRPVDGAHLASDVANPGCLLSPSRRLHASRRPSTMLCAPLQLFPLTFVGLPPELLRAQQSKGGTKQRVLDEVPVSN